MKELTGIILLGSFGTALLQIFPLRATAKACAFLLASLYFLVYTMGFAAAAALLGWLLGVYLLTATCRSSSPQFRVRLIAAYVVAVVAAFLSFKLGAWPSPERNILVGSSVPVGFSFIMFFSIAFLLDHSDREVVLPSVLSFLSGAFFFPTILAGPYVRMQDHERELRRSAEPREVFEGYCLFCLGVFRFGISQALVRPRFLDHLPLDGMHPNPQHPVSLLLLASTYLYLNFSGFSDLVVGLSWMMGIRVPRNFRFPFLSESMADFWRRWHITLGAWFRDYFFFPACKASHERFPRLAMGQLGIRSAVFITFLLLGAWHGLTEKFFLWAALNALLVSFVPPLTNTRWLNQALLFPVILLVNGLFLSKSIATYLTLLGGIFSGAGFTLRDAYGAVIALGLLVLAALLEKPFEWLVEIGGWRLVGINFLLCLLNLSVGLIFGMNKTDFTYFGL